ncbi:MAG: SH3 domain-containing protein [Pseudomonadota bacterium]
MPLRVALAIWVAFSGVIAADAQEIQTTNRATDVRAQPDESAPLLQALSAQTKVQLIERKGAWSRVKTDSHTGWVRMMHLRGGVILEEQPQAGAKSGGGFMSGFNKFLGGNQQSNQRAQSATLGVRGLSPDELQTATPNPQQLAAMKSFSANKPDAERFAKEVPLTKTDVPDPADSGRGGRR